MSDPTTTKSKVFSWKAVRIGKHFRNLHTNFVPGWRDILRWKQGKSNEVAPNPEDFPFVPQTTTPNFAMIHNPDPAQIVVTWVGHSTFLIQIGGRNLLTDPHFGNYCAPVPLKRFRRHSPPGMTIDQLPRIDAILISHNHYDHLDRDTLKKLERKSLLSTHHGIEIICPSGVGRLLWRWGFQKVTEMTWGDNTTLWENSAVNLRCLPAQHGSARTPYDRNESLWCGWLLEHANRKVAFVGDSGYAPFFTEMGDWLGGVDLALIPIGAYRPRWFMHPLHMNPEEAVKVHRELKARTSLAMHWGTFELADDPLGEPPVLFKQARAEASVGEDEFRLLSFGETVAV